jgi:hypothetical protein
MAARNQLEVLWEEQPKKWQGQYLHSFGRRPDAALGDQDNRVLLASVLKSADSAYANARATGNPLWIWVAHRMFRDRGLPLPEWILVYLDEVARRLQTMMYAPPENPHSAIAEALLMKRRGRGSVFTTYQNIFEMCVAIDLVNARSKGEPVHIGIGRAAQKLRIDKRTARRHRDSLLRQAREGDGR